MSWLLLALAILTEVAATMALRASDGLRRKVWALPIAVGYIAAFVLLGFALDAGMPVGIAYGTWAAIGIALTAVLAKVIFHEPLTRLMAVGILLLSLGVALVEVGAATGH